MSELVRDGEAAPIPISGWADVLLEGGTFHSGQQTREEVLASFQSKRPKVVIDFDNNVLMHGPSVEEMRLVCDRKPGSVRVADIPEWYMNTKMWWLHLREGYRFNPFEREITQQFALGRGRPEAVATNVGPEISGTEQQSILDAYSWFDVQTSGAVFTKAPHITIGHHLAYQYDRTAPRLVLAKPMGLYDPSNRLISISSIVTNGMVPEHAARRYSSLLESGVSLTDIVTTHELAHAMFFDYRYVNMFRERVGWLEKFMELGKGRKASWHILEGLKGDNLPPTDYGQYSSVEDIAESTVYYRYAPELLDPARVEALDEMFAALAVEGEGGGIRDVEMTELEVPLYPHRRLPEQLIIRFKPLRPSFMQKIGEKLVSEVAKDMQIILGTSDKQRYNSVQ